MNYYDNKQQKTLDVMKLFFRHFLVITAIVLMLNLHEKNAYKSYYIDTIIDKNNTTNVILIA